MKSSSNCPLFSFSRLVAFAMHEGQKQHTCARVTKGGKGERRETEREDGMGDHTPHHHITSDSFTHTFSIEYNQLLFSYHAKDHNNSLLSHHSCPRSLFVALVHLFFFVSLFVCFLGCVFVCLFACLVRVSVYPCPCHTVNAPHASV